jgi:FdhE protein
MPRTTAGLRNDSTARLAELEQQRPEYGVWLGLLAEVEQVAARQPHQGRESRVASSSSPLLHGAMLLIDAAETRELIIRLAHKACALENGVSLCDFRPSREDSVQLIGAAVRQDGSAIGSVAREKGLDSGALASVAHLAALPTLRAAGGALNDHIAQHWPHGYCPVCAAWPNIAERRGLDRGRWLRCGRCAAEWELEWLTCVYCGERDHQQLGSLVLDNGGELVKVETCASCRGYLKSIATLQGFPPLELLLQDLETVEFDILALDREYFRPSAPGFSLEIQVADR